jgi:glyoxylase-like metal-dependent hydrolase (beta-lactamase superfamily II)
LIPAASADEFQATRVIPAKHTFDPRAGLVLHFGDEDVRIMFPGAAHSTDNVAIDFPSRGVLFGGCMVRSADSLGPTEGTDLQQWSDAIAALQALKPSVVVPGHGIRYDAEQLDDTRALLSAAIAAARPAVGPL